MFPDHAPHHGRNVSPRVVIVLTLALVASAPPFLLPTSAADALSTSAPRLDGLVVNPPYTFDGPVRVAFSVTATGHTCPAPPACPPSSAWHVFVGETFQEGAGVELDDLEGELVASGTTDALAPGENARFELSVVVDVEERGARSWWVKVAVAEHVSSTFVVRSDDLLVMARADQDADGVADDLETALCTRTVERDLVDGNGGALGACSATGDYAPPARSFRLFVPTSTTRGGDDDGDGLPTHLNVDVTAFDVDRSGAGHISDPSDAGRARLPVDLDDDDDGRPGLTEACLAVPVPAAVAAPEDADGDGFPAYARVSRAETCIDRRDPADVRMTAASALLEAAVDPDDSDPLVPAGDAVSVGPLLVNLTFSTDADHDGLPGAAFRGLVRLDYDRASPNLPNLSSTVEHHPFDPDDDDRHVPVPWLALDADGDWVPDAAEPYACLWEGASSDLDGSCSLYGVDYHVPAAYAIHLYPV